MVCYRHKTNADLSGKGLINLFTVLLNQSPSFEIFKVKVASIQHLAGNRKLQARARQQKQAEVGARCTHRSSFGLCL